MKGSSRSALSTLSNNDLLAATRALVGRSNEVTAQLITHLAEVDDRKLYLEQAEPSMFAWCVAELGCSEDVACNWIAVARASRRYPAVLDALRGGKVHLTGLRMLAPHLTEEGHLALLDEAAGKSKREIEELVARIAPRPAVPASMRKLASGRNNGGNKRRSESRNDGTNDIRSGCEPANGSGVDGAEATPATAGDKENLRGAEGGGGGPESSSVSTCENGELLSSAQLGSLGEAPQPSQRARAAGRVEPLSGEAYKVTFTASRRLRDKLRQAQDLLGHQVPGGDLAQIVERGLDLLMEDVRKKRFAAGRKPRPSKRTRAMDKGSSPAQKDPPAAAGEPKVGGDSNAGREERPSRYIPAEVRRAVHERDGEQCTFVDERGKRCPARRRLELDHAEGFARGAPHTVEGLRLRCKPHNQRAAEKMYGRFFMEEKRAAAKSSAPARVDVASPEERSNQAS